MFIQTRGPLVACMLNDYVLKKCLLGIWGPPGARGPGAWAPVAPLLIRHWLQLTTIFQYELCAVPPSLIDEYMAVYGKATNRSFAIVLIGV